MNMFIRMIKVDELVKVVPTPKLRAVAKPAV